MVKYEQYGVKIIETLTYYLHSKLSSLFFLFELENTHSNRPRIRCIDLLKHPIFIQGFQLFYSWTLLLEVFLILALGQHGTLDLYLLCCAVSEEEEKKKNMYFGIILKLLKTRC